MLKLASWCPCMCSPSPVPHVCFSPLMWGRARRVAFFALKVWTVGGQSTAIVSDFTFELMSKPVPSRGSVLT